MAKTNKPVIVNVDRSNIDETGFFCYMSKRKSEGYLRKLAWVKARLDEGMRTKMLKLPERGFIEYMPGEYSWRAVIAPHHMVIHCLWVVGQSKGKGYGAALLDACVADAKKAGMDGVAMVASPGNWLAGRKILEKNGFRAVDTAPPSFILMVKTFKPGPAPSFPRDWEARAARFGKGLTIITSGQCPYHPAAIQILREAARREGLNTRVIELCTAEDVQTRSPSPYGVFGIVLDGRLLNYHYLTEAEFRAALTSKP